MNALTVMDGIILTLIGVVCLIVAFMSREFRWIFTFLGLCVAANKLELYLSFPLIFFLNFLSLMPQYREVNENHIQQPFTREQFGEMTSFALLLTLIIFILGKAVPFLLTNEMYATICHNLPFGFCQLLQRL